MYLGWVKYRRERSGIPLRAVKYNFVTHSQALRQLSFHILLQQYNTMLDALVSIMEVTIPPRLRICS
jgi:hypothetical protein